MLVSSLIFLAQTLVQAWPEWLAGPDTALMDKRITTQCFSRPMPLLLLYSASSFDCSSFFVGCVRTVRSTCVGIRNAIRGLQLLYS